MLMNNRLLWRGWFHSLLGRIRGFRQIPHIFSKRLGLYFYNLDAYAARLNKKQSTPYKN